MDLEPLSPSEGVELYLEDRRNELSDQTRYSHRSRLGKFVDWCREQGLENLNDLDGRDLMQFKHWRRDEGELQPVTLTSHLSTLRVFLRFCERINAVEEGLADRIELPDLGETEQVNDRRIEAERAQEVLTYLERFEYASREHALFALAWETGLRLGSLRALDVDDYDSNGRYVDVVHRPDTDTPLKNGPEGERQVNLSDSLCHALDDYVDRNRPPVTDDFGREPLFATERGRMATSTIRRLCYQITRPCIYANDCPHGRDLQDCEARQHGNASKCPSSVSPHAVRRGSIMHHRNSGVDIRVVSDRVNATDDVIEKHYDRRTEEQKRDQRRRHLAEKIDGFGADD